VNSLSELFSVTIPVTKKYKIAVGLEKFEDIRIQSLKRSREFAEIYIVTGEESNREKLCSDFEIIKSSTPEKKLISLLKSNEVDGILRGSLDAVTLHNEYFKIFGERSVTVPSLLNRDNIYFFLTLLSGFHGWDKYEKLKEIESVAKFLKKNDISQKIAVFTAVRKKSLESKNDISDKIKQKLDETIIDADFIVDELIKKGFDAENREIELYQAIKAGFNILVPVNGIVGNQLFRAFIAGGFQNIFSPRLGVNQYFADNDRNQDDLYLHIKNLTICMSKGITFKF